MASNDELNNTDGVLSTQSPQESSSASDGSSNVQQTASPDKVTNNQDVSVLQTGEPISGGTQSTDTTSAAPYVFGGVAVVVVIAIIVLVMRLKNFSSSVSTSSLRSEDDLPRPAARSSAKTGSTTKKSTVKKTSAKKKGGKRKPTRKARH
jgi:hypothetical protein